ncbi:hypothetical protein [Streptomyces sp. NPDC059460]|uniref:hypothetical protein n=1 Tax=Streptomyces sp. NPDC059460 TaxID=3346840 RepID=UPI0036C77E30
MRDQARVWLKDLQCNVGITTVYVTHDQIEAMSVAEREAKAGTQRIQNRSGCAQYATVGPGLTHAHW